MKLFEEHLELALPYLEQAEDVAEVNGVDGYDGVSAISMLEGKLNGLANDTMQAAVFDIAVGSQPLVPEHFGALSLFWSLKKLHTGRVRPIRGTGINRLGTPEAYTEAINHMREVIPANLAAMIEHGKRAAEGEPVVVAISRKKLVNVTGAPALVARFIGEDYRPDFSIRLPVTQMIEHPGNGHSISLGYRDDVKLTGADTIMQYHEDPDYLPTVRQNVTTMANGPLNQSEHGPYMTGEIIKEAAFYKNATGENILPQAFRMPKWSIPYALQASLSIAYGHIITEV